MAKTYDTYKDSGIAWIGEIPSEWKIVKGKTLFHVTTGKLDANAAEENGEYPFFTCSMIPKKINTFSFDCEALLVAGNGIVGFTQYYKGKFNAYQRTYVLYDFKDVYTKFLKHYVSNNLSIEVEPSSVGSVIQFIKLGDLTNFNVALPSYKEQQVIASFLDTKCGEIDSLISIQEEMISELLAYKQSIITEAVTKGLDKKAKMKNSGIEWIGDIPEEWDVQKLRTLGWCQNGISKSGDYFGEDYEYPFVSYPDAYKNFEVPYPKGRANSTLEDRQRYSLVKGDVLFTRTSETIEEIGFASTCTETIPNAVFSGFLIRFRPTSSKIYYGYSKYFFRSVIHRAFFVKEMNLVTRASLSQDLLKNLPVVLPKIEEQQAIATYLDEKTSQIDSLIALKQSKIESLKEYKKSIIYEYVTGKKRV